MLTVDGLRWNADRLRQRLEEIGLHALPDDTVSVTEALLRLAERPEQHIVLFFRE